jgi:hypothetical protein
MSSTGFESQDYSTAMSVEVTAIVNEEAAIPLAVSQVDGMNLPGQPESESVYGFYNEEDNTFYACSSL